MDSATALHTTGGGEGSIPPELPGGNESIAADRLQPAADNGSNGIVDVSAGRDVAESSQGSTDEAGDAPCRTSTSPSADTAPKGANDTVSDDTASLAEKSVAATARTSEEAVSGAGATDGEIGTEPAPAVHTVETDEAEGRDEATAADLKREGNELFKAGRMEEALALYDEAVAVAPLRAEGAPKLAALHANRAACLLSLGRHEECIAACDDCLDLDPRYVKAMLRRVKALEKLDMLEEAQQGEPITLRGVCALAGTPRIASADCQTTGVVMNDTDNDGSDIHVSVLTLQTTRTF